MIQTAAPSASSNISIASVIQAAPADDTTASGDFAALLDSKAAPDAEGTADPATAMQAALGLQIRQTAGSAAGKKLPGEIADAAAALADAAAKIGDGSGEDGEATTDATLTVPTADILLPGLVVPVAIQLPQTPTLPTITPAATGDALGQAAAKATPTLPMTSQPAIAAALALQTETTKVAGQPQTAPTVTLDPAAAAAAQADPALAKMAADAAAQQSTTATATATPTATTVSTAAALAQQVNGQVNGQANGQTTAPDGTPKIAEGLRTGSQPATKATGEQPSTLATLTTNQQMQAQKTTEPTAEPTASAKGDASPAPQVQAKTPSVDVTAETALQGESKKSDSRLAATADAETPTISPATTTAPTVLAAHDGQSLSQTVASVTTAPATAVQSGHDFAKLVDRLVEAREAANPGTVHASLNHAEFGQVSLRIDQDSKGMSVTMSSADPDFANAVQATAASAQSQTSSDDRQNQQRQDAQRQDTGSQLQQQGASLTGQSQSQTFGQGGERDGRNAAFQGETPNARANQKSTIIEDNADTRSGIYA